MNTELQIESPEVSVERLPISARTVLVDLGTVRAVLGLDTVGVLKRVELGHLQWVFDFGQTSRGAKVASGKRELRFWVREIIAPEQCAHLNLAQAVMQIVGADISIRRTELERRWVVSHVTVFRWIRDREIYLFGRSEIARQSLADFLMKRHYAG